MREWQHLATGGGKKLKFFINVYRRNLVIRDIAEGIHHPASLIGQASSKLSFHPCSDQTVF
jgi:hypothetical protein